jgi:Mn2+/Fe2+ NRAMP family transporter
MGFKKLIKLLGPGLLYAGAAVGVSHLVQSTRAGAGYGYDLIWILLLANIIKYPFFEFAPRYAASMNESLIEGYKRIGNWAIIAFVILTVATMFTIQGAVTIVTAGIMANIFNISMDVTALSAIILSATVIVLIIGRFAILDKLIKLVIIILTISTLIAVIYAFDAGTHAKNDLVHHFDWLHPADILFLIAFIGWMPAPLDVSVWQSLWNIEKRKRLTFKTSLKEPLLDFRIGYIGTALLALCFLLLGALVLHGTGEELSSNGSVFAGQLISLYTESIGAWSKPVIAIAALTTMFSTTLTCIDAYPRVLRPTTKMLFPAKFKNTKHDNKLYWVWMVVVMAGALIMLKYFATSMRYMVDVATTLSFVTAPVFAFLNYKVVTGKFMPGENRPGMLLRIWAWIGIIFLWAFTLFYIAWRAGWIK